MTIAELIIALAVTAIVLGALAGLTLGVSKGWTANDGSQSVQMQTSQIYDRVRYYLSAAKYIAQFTPGSLTDPTAPSACICYWESDNWNGLADGAPEGGEMQMILYDPTSKTLWLYAPKAVSLMSSSDLTAAGTVVSWATISGANWPTSFPTVPYVVPTALGLNVTGAAFNVNWSGTLTQRPVIEFSITTTRSPQPATTQYQAITLRSPTTQPD